MHILVYVIIESQHTQKASGSLCLNKRHDEAISGELKCIFFNVKILQQSLSHKNIPKEQQPCLEICYCNKAV